MWEIWRILWVKVQLCTSHDLKRAYRASFLEIDSNNVKYFFRENVCTICTSQTGLWLGPLAFLREIRLSLKNKVQLLSINDSQWKTDSSFEERESAILTSPMTLWLKNILRVLIEHRYGLKLLLNYITYNN